MANKKLFEHLVVEPQLKTQAAVLVAGLHDTFAKKRHLFGKTVKTFFPIEEGATPVTEEQSDIQTSVRGELKWLTEIWTKALDTSYTIAEGNTHARANVVLDNGTVLLENAPATALLELEKKMTEFQQLLAAIPTLDPAKGFTPDPAAGANIFKAREVPKPRTKKVQEVLVKYHATDKHPAQTEIISIDKVSGTIQEQEWSSMITPAMKSDMLARAEDVRRALKAALHRANAVELTSEPKCGKKLFDYILGPEG